MLVVGAGVLGGIFAGGSKRRMIGGAVATIAILVIAIILIVTFRQ